MKKQLKEDKSIDEALKDSFPASDPPFWTAGIDNDELEKEKERNKSLKEKSMSYKTNSSLPENVKNHLPSHAQDIYRSAFNKAIEEYKNPEKRQDISTSAEETAHKVAWGAVKEKYKKNETTGEWREK